MSLLVQHSHWKPRTLTRTSALMSGAALRTLSRGVVRRACKGRPDTAWPGPDADPCASQSVPRGQRQPAWGARAICGRVSRSARRLPPPAPAAPDKWAFSRFDSLWWGSLASVHVSTLDLLRVHWPEIMSPVCLGGRDFRSGRPVCPATPPPFNTLNMHYWISTPFL